MFPRDARRPPPSWQPWQPAGPPQTFTQKASDGCFSKHRLLQKFSVCIWLQKAYTDKKNLSKAPQCRHFSGLLVNLFSVKSIFLNPNMDHNLFAIIEMLSISNRSLISSRAISYSSTIWLFFKWQYVTLLYEWALMQLYSSFSNGINKYRLNATDLENVCCSIANSRLTLCNPRDCGPPGSSFHGVHLAGILEWVAISFSRGSSRTRDRTCMPYIGRLILYPWATREAPRKHRQSQKEK